MTQYDEEFERVYAELEQLETLLYKARIELGTSFAIIRGLKNEEDKGNKRREV